MSHIFAERNFGFSATQHPPNNRAGLRREHCLRHIDSYTRFAKHALHRGEWHVNFHIGFIPIGPAALAAQYADHATSHGHPLKVHEKSIHQWARHRQFFWNINADHAHREFLFDINPTDPAAIGDRPLQET